MTPRFAAPTRQGALNAKIVPGALLAASGLALFALHWRPGAYALLAATLVAALVVDRPFFRDLVLIAIGLVALSLVPVTTDVSPAHMLLMGSALVVAVAAPYLLSRFAYRDHAVRFPVATGRRWSRTEIVYLVAVLVLGWAILPVYLIGSGVYENWPAAGDAGTIARLFVGTNALGIWDELFFICTCFTLLRRHLPIWQANVVQAVLFTSFLWELGFRSWGPLLIYPFALVQGWIFSRTKSLSYVVSVHLLFDLVLFLVLLHAHERSWFPIFVY